METGQTHRQTSRQAQSEKEAVGTGGQQSTSRGASCRANDAKAGLSLSLSLAERDLGPSTHLGCALSCTLSDSSHSKRTMQRKR